MEEEQPRRKEFSMMTDEKLQELLLKLAASMQYGPDPLFKPPAERDNGHKPVGTISGGLRSAVTNKLKYKRLTEEVDTN